MLSALAAYAIRPGLAGAGQTCQLGIAANALWCRGNAEVLDRWVRNRWPGVSSVLSLRRGLHYSHTSVDSGRAGGRRVDGSETVDMQGSSKAAEGASGASSPRHKIYCFEWARGIAAAMVVLIHVMTGIMDNYPIEVVGGGVASLSGLCCNWC